MIIMYFVFLSFKHNKNEKKYLNDTKRPPSDERFKIIRHLNYEEFGESPLCVCLKR